jgi:hypothetical protein
MAGVLTSESNVKRGNWVVGTDAELVEKLDRNDPCPFGSGREAAAAARSALLG